MHIEELPKRKGRFIERERVCREREREREREQILLEKVCPCIVIAPITTRKCHFQ
jgi:hypothetical protein